MDQNEPENKEIIKKPSSPKFKLGMIAALVGFGLLGGAYAVKNTSLFQLSSSEDVGVGDRMDSFEKKVNKQIESLRTGLPALIAEEVRKVSNEEGFGSLSELQKRQISVEVISKINLNEKIDLAIDEKAEGFTVQAANLARDSIERDLPELIKEVVTPILEPYRIFNSSQVRYNESVDARFLTFENQISNLRTEMSSRANSIAIPEQSRQRLREFNVLGEMADGVFSVQAPDRSTGKSHYVTLYNGEPFSSKLGRHKVTGIQGDGEDAVLLIGTKYYIDKKRDEYTPTQLAQFKKARQKRAKPSPSEPEVQIASNEPSATVEAMTTVDHIGKLPPAVVETQTVMAPVPDTYSQPSMASTPRRGVQYLNGKILLPDWATVTKGPNLETALVVNLAKSEGERTFSIRKGKYYNFIGTVEEISPDGSICSATYCIGALR
ncbi:hypothetical protein [Vibrio splendidus]|uniref:hypothetical protein n=1 Tax=Vibrio splendidus TaxID=29497 RepID=UPI003D12992A